LIHSSAVFADPMQWDAIRITNWGNGWNRGGAFLLSATDGDYTDLKVFCVETQSEFYPNSVYSIYDISKNSISGGTATFRTLNTTSDALMYLFASRRLSEYDGSSQAQASLQYLFWALESQVPESDSHNGVNDAWVACYLSQAHSLIGQNPARDDFGSVVLNLGVLQANGTYSDNQSQIWNPGTPIPEPSSLLLLGLGITALGFIAARNKRP
jgi:hypothetical protein